MGKQNQNQDGQANGQRKEVNNIQNKRKVAKSKYFLRKRNVKCNAHETKQKNKPFPLKNMTKSQVIIRKKSNEIKQKRLNDQVKDDQLQNKKWKGILKKKNKGKGKRKLKHQKFVQHYEMASQPLNYAPLYPQFKLQKKSEASLRSHSYFSLSYQQSESIKKRKQMIDKNFAYPTGYYQLERQDNFQQNIKRRIGFYNNNTLSINLNLIEKDEYKFLSPEFLYQIAILQHQRLKKYDFDTEDLQKKNKYLKFDYDYLQSHYFYSQEKLRLCEIDLKETQCKLEESIKQNQELNQTNLSNKQELIKLALQNQSLEFENINLKKKINMKQSQNKCQ